MNNYFKMFFRRISKDFKQKQLLPLKLLFFMHSSTILVLYPYLTIHMRELGINVEETAIMSAVTPVIAVLMPPIAGMIADKIGNFRVLLSLFSALGGLAALLLLLVPVGRITITYPDKVVFSMSCSPRAPLMLSLSQHHPCESPDVQNSTEFQLESCGFACHAVLPKNYTNFILRTPSYGVQMYDVQNNATRTFTYTLNEEDIHVPVVLAETYNHKTLKNNDRYLTSIRKMAKNSFFFPTSGLFNFSCDTEKNTCAIGTRDVLDRFQKKLGTKFNATVKPLQQTEDDIVDKRRVYEIFLGEQNSVCLDGYVKSGQHVSITIPIEDGSGRRHLDLGSCATRCLLTAPRKNLCTNQKTVIELDMQLTFWSYMLIRVFVGIVSGTAFAMFEGAVIAILREHNADYGLQRIYATIGGMMSSPVSGFLIDYASRGKGYTDFSPIFYLYAGLKLISGFLMLFINLEFKKPSTSVISDVISVLKNTELIALFLACLTMGSAWGYIESFLFWLLQDLGGTKSLMGLTITVGGLVGIPLLVLSGPIIKKVGHANVLCISFGFFVIRLLGYSFIYNPWLCLIFEAMESVTMGLCFTAAVTYAAKLSTVTTDTTVQAMLAGLYYAFGKGVGSLVGGYLIEASSIRTTFRIFAGFTGITGLIYFGFYHLYMKKRSTLKATAQTTKDAEKPPNPDFIDSNVKVNGHPELPAVYEDALANPAFEDTEDTSPETTSHI